MGGTEKTKPGERRPKSGAKWSQAVPLTQTPPAYTGTPHAMEMQAYAPELPALSPGTAYFWSHTIAYLPLRGIPFHFLEKPVSQVSKRVTTWAGVLRPKWLEIISVKNFPPHRVGHF